MFAPEPIAKRVLPVLKDASRMVFGQCATVDAKGLPQVRTVHWRYLPLLNAIGFAAYTKSPKWEQLESCRMLAGCYFDENKAVQWRWCGSVQLITLENKSHIETFQQLWSETRIDIQEGYWADFNPYQTDTLSCCPTFGVISCIPQEWDLLVLHAEDYRKNERLKYKFVPIYDIRYTAFYYRAPLIISSTISSTVFPSVEMLFCARA